MFKAVRFIFMICAFGMMALTVLSIVSGNDIRGVESNVIYSIQTILDQNDYLYQNPNQLPYALTQYMPLYYVLNDLVLTVLQVDTSEVLKIRWVSRSISLGLLLWSVLILYTIGLRYFKLPKSRIWELLALFVIISYPWFSLTRPDALVSFLYLLSLLLFIKFQSSQKMVYIAFIGGVGLLSIASKQSGFCFLLIIGVFFIVNKNWKALQFLTLGFLVTGILFWLTIEIAGYHFKYIFDNTIGGIKEFSLRKAIVSTYKDFILYYLLLILGLVIIFDLHSKKKLKLQESTISLSFFLKLLIVLGIGISALLALKKGSGINYFNDAIFALLVWLGYRLSKAKKYYTRNGINVLILIYVVGIQISLLHFCFYGEKVARGIGGKYLMINNEREGINQFVRNTVGNEYFFSQDRELALEFYKNCILPQFEIETNKLRLYNLQEDLKMGKIKYLILYSKIEKSIFGEYSNLFYLNENIGSYKIYRFINDCTETYKL
ncbi:hypothetical protein [Mangrovimonas sp. DI 80]|uniref:hypothetical protein n=1 Tax=Mangrovimonas sp. DI 80 TaxID=1779330 RepID=UPI000975DD80|nr:hypothetical protein [Mangrovimonas sp. DI 80]OMP31168.1 hypothetical protein BKM32_08895 [Mangrovimonas sp. DI 80]